MFEKLVVQWNYTRKHKLSLRCPDNYVLSALISRSLLLIDCCVMANFEYIFLLLPPSDVMVQSINFAVGVR